jgi:tetratricopeptide (TPR) repeat protein
MFSIQLINLSSLRNTIFKITKKINMNIKIALFTALFLPLFFAPLFTQNKGGAEIERYQLAQSYENTGNYEEAGRLYKELFNEQKSNVQYFDSYLRAYKELHKYSELIEDVKTFIEKHPQIKYRSGLAELYWKIGENQKANDEWEKIIADNIKNPEAYETISYDQIGLRQYEKAIETLVKGRKNIGAYGIFAEQLSRYYALIGDFKNGIEEVLLLEADPNLRGYAQSRLYGYLGNAQAVTYFDNRLTKEIEKNSNNYELYQLMLWYYRSTNREDKAFDICVVIDKLRKASGREIYYFADQARYDGDYDIAIRAYNFIINMGTASPYRSTAFYGLTRSLEARAVESDSIKLDEMKIIVDSYLRMAKDFSANPQSDESLFRAANLEYMYLKKTDDAIKILQNLTSKARTTDIKTKASLKLGEIYIAQNDLPKAKDEFRNILTRYTNLEQVDADQARYNLAMLEYYIGNIDSAQVQFDKLGQDSKSSVANNALEYSGFITENKPNADALNLYRNAELLRMQNKSELAAEKFIAVSASAPKTNIGEKSLIKAANIYEDTKQKPRAFDIWQKSANEYPNGIYSDLVYYNIANYNAEIKNYDEAMKYYKKLLVVYPHSIYVEDARKKARALRDEKKVTGGAEELH